MTDPVVPQPVQMQPTFEAHTPAFAPPQQPGGAYAPAPVTPKPKKTGIVVLAVLVVLLLGAAGTFGSLYFAEKGRSADLSSQLQGKTSEVEKQTKLAADNADEKTKALAAQKKAEDDSAAAQKCRAAAKALTEAAIADDRVRGENALKDILLSC